MMQFVSFNLDLDDVPIVRRALSDTMAACVCAAMGPGKRCADCVALDGLIQELERAAQRANGVPRCRSIPAPPSQAFAADRCELDFESISALPVDLRVLRGGLDD
jgi:hypothetical protein